MLQVTITVAWPGDIQNSRTLSIYLLVYTLIFPTGCGRRQTLSFIYAPTPGLLNVWQQQTLNICSLGAKVMAHEVMCFPRKYEDPNSNSQEACQYWVGIEAHLGSQNTGSKDNEPPCTCIVTHSTQKCYIGQQLMKVPLQTWHSHGHWRNVLICSPLTSLWGRLRWVSATTEEDSSPTLTPYPSLRWVFQSLTQWQLS